VEDVPVAVVRGPDQRARRRRSRNRNGRRPEPTSSARPRVVFSQDRAAGDDEEGRGRGRGLGLRLQLSGDAGDEALEEAGEAVLDLAAGLKDFLVTELGRAETGGKVGDAGDAKNLEAHVAGDDGFRYRGHAHQRGPQAAEGADFRRGFKAGAGDGEVDAFGQREAFFLSSLPGQSPQRF
jgi:hypothetical protein